jgi:hypothetical protein
VLCCSGNGKCEGHCTCCLCVAVLPMLLIRALCVGWCCSCSIGEVGYLLRVLFPYRIHCLLGLTISHFLKLLPAKRVVWHDKMGSILSGYEGLGTV